MRHRLVPVENQKLLATDELVVVLGQVDEGEVERVRG